MIDCSVFILTLLHTGVVQLIVGCFTVRQFMIGINGYFVGDAIVVGAIVRDIQLTITIDQRQVTIAIQSTCMTSTQRNEVTMEDIIDGSRGITEHRIGVGTRRHSTRISVTTGKDRIMDDDTRLVQATPSGGIGILVLQHVQFLNRHIVAFGIAGTINGQRHIDLTHGFNKHLAVLGELALGDVVTLIILICYSILILINWYCYEVPILILIIVTLIQRIVAYTILLALSERAVSFLVGTIDKTNIATTKHVTVTVGHTGHCTDFTTMNTYFGLTEYETIAVE